MPCILGEFSALNYICKVPVMSGSRLALLLSVLLLGISATGHAQVPLDEREGTSTLEGWPRSLPELLDDMGSKAPYLLPRIDSLALDYRYAVTDSTSRWSFVLSWRPAEQVLYEGEVLPWRERPRDVRMTNVEFRADVRVNGEKKTEMIIGVDSMALRAAPDRFAFNVTVSHDRVFLDTPADRARRLLSKGISLNPLVVERMGFSAAGAERREEQSPDARRRREEPSREPSIYAPDTRIRIGWRVAPDPYYVGNEAEDGGESRTERPRGETIGRTPEEGTDRSRGADRGDASGESGDEGERGRADGGDESSEEGDDEDEEDDETDLRTPALAAAAAVGLIAFAGGTVGLYGRGDTPIGLASGYTHPKGGVQMQAAVNAAVIENKPNQKLSLEALGFYDVFTSRVQPAVGLGVQIDPDNGNDVEPTFSGGIVGNFGKFLLYGGFDVVQQTPEIGLMYDFRHGPDN